MSKVNDAIFRITDEVLTLSEYADIPNNRTMFRLELKYHERLYELMNPGDIFFTVEHPEATITIEGVEAILDTQTIKVTVYLNNEILN